MIIYGSRMYGKRDEVITHGYCRGWDRTVQHKSYNGRKFGHVYFIPLFPCGKPSRVIQECGKCGIGSHIPEAEVPGICQGLTEDLHQCVEASARGEHRIKDADGEELDTAPVLASTIEMLTVLNNYGPVGAAIKELGDDSYERHVAEAVHEELGGQLQRALKCAKSAARANKEAVWPIAKLAEYSGRLKRHDDQLKLLDRAIKMVGPTEALGLKIQKLSPLESLKEFGQMLDVMDECMQDSPKLAQDKVFAKERKKVEKKARKLGQID